MSVVCELGVSQVYDSDLVELTSNGWLNDNHINFWCEYMSQRLFGTHPQMCFVFPGSAFIIAFEEDPEDLRDTVAGCGITADKTTVFIPVNDSESALASGGTHWALLAYSAAHHKFFYFDSISSSNSRAAKRLASKLWPFFDSYRQTQEDAKTPSSASGAMASSSFVAMPCPQQLNSYDCGVYALTVAETLASVISKGGDAFSAESQSLLRSKVTPRGVTAQRRRMAECIRDVGRSSG